MNSHAQNTWLKIKVFIIRVQRGVPLNPRVQADSSRLSSHHLVVICESVHSSGGHHSSHHSTCAYFQCTYFHCRSTAPVLERRNQKIRILTKTECEEHLMFAHCFVGNNTRMEIILTASLPSGTFNDWEILWYHKVAPLVRDWFLFPRSPGSLKACDGHSLIW